MVGVVVILVVRMITKAMLALAVKTAAAAMAALVSWPVLVDYFM